MSISSQAGYGLVHIRPNSASLEGFCQFFILFFVFSPTVCLWHKYFEETNRTYLAFFWPQGPLIQSSAAPQGLPPPNQQKNIRNTNKLNRTITLPTLSNLPTIETFESWGTDFYSDKREHELMTIFVSWQLRVTLDSIRNSCDVFGRHRVI